MIARAAILVLAALLAACATAPLPPPDTIALAGRVRACPPERVQENAQTEGFGATSGVTIEEVAIVAATGEPARAIRMRRFTVAPGGVIAWHEHGEVQGMALIVSGEMTELRNSCLDPIVYRAGDIAIEDAGAAHSWRNAGDADAIIFVSHIIAE
jgi:quercetin dioxygenase-like cupin family protein